MSELFLTVLNMSLTASYVILFVMLVRLLLKKAPKVISYVLWGVVAFRLIIPFSFESMFSLIPRNANAVPIPHDIIYQQTPQINSRIEAVDPFVSQSLPAPTAGASANPFQIYVEIGAYIWVFGIIALLVYSLVSILILKRQLKSAQLIEKNIFQVHNLQTPFVLGLVRPKIYLPVGLSKEEQNYILIHEQTHIHRKDHIIKIIAFLIVSIHWFNPLVWIAFVLMSTDMELSCDERVLKVMDEDIKKPYANTLLSLATGRHILNGSPLAFGEGNVKGRIKNVLNYKKPRFWIIFFSIIIVVTIGIGLVANPKSLASFNGSSYRVKEILYDAPMYSFSYTLDTVPQYSISSDYKLYSKEITDKDWIMHGGLYPCEISRQELSALFHSPSDNVREAINKTKLIYRADKKDDDIKTFYLVMQLKDGDVLFALGYDNDETRHIRWLFRLEKISDFNGEAADINSTDIRWDAAADDLSGLTDTIVTSVNGLLSDKLSRKVTSNDINYDNAFKVYVGVDVFKMETTNISELKNALEAGGYIYEIPLYIDGDTILVDIAKGQPLNNNAEFTEEEKENIIANEGKWQVTAVKYYRNEIVNYATEVSAKIGKVPEGAILVGGLPRFRFAVALIPDENGEVVGLLPLSKISGVEKLQTFKSADQNFYNYKEIKEYINKLPPANPDEAGSFGFLDVEAPDSNHTMTYVAIIVVIILCALTVIFIVYRKKAKIIE